MTAISPTLGRDLLHYYTDRTIPTRKRCPHCAGAFGACPTFTRRVAIRLANGFTMRQALRSAHLELAQEPAHA